MKKILFTTIIAGFATASAFAASQTIEFVRDDGTSTTIVLNDDGTTMMGDVAGTYTYDEAEMKLCGSVEGAEEVCVTFENTGSEVGDSLTLHLFYR